MTFKVSNKKLIEFLITQIDRVRSVGVSVWTWQDSESLTIKTDDKHFCEYLMSFK